MTYNPDSNCDWYDPKNPDCAKRIKVGEQGEEEVKQHLENWGAIVQYPDGIDKDWVCSVSGIRFFVDAKKATEKNQETGNFAVADTTIAKAQACSNPSISQIYDQAPFIFVSVSGEMAMWQPADLGDKYWQRERPNVNDGGCRYYRLIPYDECVTLEELYPYLLYWYKSMGKDGLLDERVIEDNDLSHTSSLRLEQQLDPKLISLMKRPKREAPRPAPAKRTRPAYRSKTGKRASNGPRRKSVRKTKV